MNGISPSRNAMICEKKKREREESLDRRLHDFTISLNLAPEFGTDWP